MKKIFLVTFSTALASLLIGCGGGSGNSNNANTNAGSSPTANSNANSNSVAQSTPLPEYTDAETAFADGNKFFDANRTELAVEAYSQAVKLNPEFAEAWFKLGVSHALIEKEKEIEAFNEEVEETPTPTPSRKVRKDAPVARTKDSEKAFEKAVAAYKKITAKDPKNDLAFFNLGRSYDKLDEDEDAEKALRQAVKLKEDDTLYQTEFGAILVKLARYDEAVKALKKAIELDPENSAAEELLEKAEAGKRRVNFGTTPKPQQQNDPSKSSKSSKSTEDNPSDQTTKPGTTPDKTDKKPEKKPEQPKKLGKTGDQRH
jgi:tetratricopeptide (TPR) repeat protein